ncbi:hypothetical protein [Conexibacter sp. SYSU D00693]|uniref:hypothetical protein n=1 Tax=Conexibacter sp. SYSU D00693 TaxID=2812560 RepID=UPI00196B38C7|nr:hypothetical protein [Conexibacter sp. SYSU D00693]
MALCLAAVAGALAVHHNQSRSSNLLAEATGGLASIGVALLLIDWLTRRERQLRYADLTWVVVESAVNTIEDVEGALRYFARSVQSQSSVMIELRTGEIQGEEPDDHEAMFWRQRTPKLEESRRRHIAEDIELCKRNGQARAAPSEYGWKVVPGIARDLEHLGVLGDRLAGPAQDSDDVLLLLHALWRLSDQRHRVLHAKALYEDGVINPIWGAMAELGVKLRRAYEAGVVASATAQRWTGRAGDDPPPLERLG